jgi:hypothetical protein
MTRITKDQVFDLIDIESLTQVSERAAQLRRKLSLRNRSGSFLRLLSALTDDELVRLDSEHRKFLRSRTTIDSKIEVLWKGMP